MHLGTGIEYSNYTGSMVTSILSPNTEETVTLDSVPCSQLTYEQMDQLRNSPSQVGHNKVGFGGSKKPLS